MSSPSIFMIGWEYPPHNSGGLGVACEGLTKALSDQNTHIYFTLPYNHHQHIDHMNVLSCVDPSWELPDGQAPFPAYPAIKRTLNGLPLDADILHTLPGSELEWRVDQYRDLVAHQAQQHRQDIDLVHAHDWMTFSAGQKIQEELHKPLVAHVHSTEFDRIPNGSGSPYIHQAEYDGLHRADEIIVVSNYTRQLLIDKYQVSPSKIHVVHNGAPELGAVNTSSARFAQRRPIIVFMGRLTVQKGPDYFIQLARKLLVDMPNALFVIAGDGDMYPQLLLSTASQGLSASVLFSGFLRGSEREQLLERADVFVMPSLSEPFGLVAVEAAQRKTPVIVSKTTGVSEVLPSALAIDFWDTNAMANAIIKLINNRPGRQVLARKQLKDVSHATWQDAATNVQKVYRKALTG